MDVIILKLEFAEQNFLSFIHMLILTTHGFLTLCVSISWLLLYCYTFIDIIYIFILNVQSNLWSIAGM